LTLINPVSSSLNPFIFTKSTFITQLQALSIIVFVAHQNPFLPVSLGLQLSKHSHRSLILDEIKNDVIKVNKEK